MQNGIGSGHPYAKGAKVSQKSQKDFRFSFAGFFCVLCESFAPFAYGGPLPHLLGPSC